MSKVGETLLGWAIFAGGAYFLFSSGVVGRVFRDAVGTCAVEKVDLKGDMFLDASGAADFGYTVSAVLFKEKRRGVLDVEARLSTSQGQYVRSRQTMMDEGERTTLQFQFPEPTIQVTDVQAIVACQPA